MIENERKFKPDFGREILCGIMDMAYGREARDRRLTGEEQREQLKHFLGNWQPYDWTQFLDGGEYQE